MKKFCLLCSILALLGTSLCGQINVTVSVDMAGITIHPTGVHLVGSFNDWNPSATPMTETSPGSGVYAAVVNRPVDDNIEYKVLNGNFYDQGTEGQGEEPTSPCSFLHNGNRVFTVPMADTVLPTFAFGGCPPGVTRVPVTFRVDVAGLDVSSGVFVVGDMVGFNGDGFTAMSQIDNTTVYLVTIMLPADLLRVNFKYSLGADFSGAESTVPAPCANPNNSDRFYRFNGVEEETQVYFFNTCDISQALPIVLTRFDAIANAKSVSVEWETAVESDVHYFRVERSSSGTDFKLLQEVTPTSAVRGDRTYRVEDKQPANDFNYYRLITVDFDGTWHLEGVRTVLFRGSDLSSSLIYPNPVTSELTVSFLGTADIKITDTLGRLVHQARATDIFNWQGVAGLVRGQYYFHLKTMDGVHQIPFIKQ